MANNNCDEPKCLAQAAMPCPDEIDLSCIQTTPVEPPQWTPTPDQLPFAHFITCDGKIRLYYHTCEEGWQYVDLSSLCELEPLDTTNVNDLCNLLKIPLTIDANGCCNEGTLTMNQFADQLIACLCERGGIFPDSPPQTIDPVQGGSISFTNFTTCTQDTVVFGAAPVPTVSVEGPGISLDPTNNPDGSINYEISLECPPTAAPITLNPTGTNTPDRVWVCDANDNIVKKPINITIPPPVPLCEEMNDLPGTAASVIPANAIFPYVLPNGTCGKGTFPEEPDDCCECAEFNVQATAGGACFDMSAAPNNGRIMFHVNDSTTAPFIRNIVGTSQALGNPRLGESVMTYTNTTGCPVWVEMRYKFGMLILQSEGRSPGTLQSLTGISGSGTLPPDPVWQGGFFDNNITRDMSVAVPSSPRHIDLVDNNNNWGYALGEGETKTIHFVPAGGSVTTSLDLYYSMEGTIVDEFLHISAEGSWFAYAARV